VEPTNNLAERMVRQAVLWRKGSFGRQSERAARYPELDVYFTINDRHALAATNSMSFEAEKAKGRTVSGQSGARFRDALQQLTHS
jgi:hypothetical protein